MTLFNLCASPALALFIPTSQLRYFIPIPTFYLTSVH